MAEMICSHCGAVRQRATGEVNRRIREAKPIYCSRECGFAARRAAAKSIDETAWHKQRFTERPNTVRQDCTECGRTMWLPPSKAGDYKRCGRECNRAWRDKNKRVVVIEGHAIPLDRHCDTCGKIFRPRPRQVRLGQGRFCSQQCNTAARAIITSPTVLAYAQQRRREAQQAGLISWKTGPDHHSWRGGPDAAKRRRQSPEGRKKQAAALRKYRAENPHKVREFGARRKGRKLGRLPRGTIPRIGSAQKWKCAICRAPIARSYHVDHITPLAKGGKHQARNIQLLCQRCNVRKSDKDPIDFMQQVGRLL